MRPLLIKIGVRFSPHGFMLVNVQTLFFSQDMGQLSVTREGYTRYLGLSEDLKVRAGDDVVLKCSATASEPPNYTWQKNVRAFSSLQTCPHPRLLLYERLPSLAFHFSPLNFLKPRFSHHFSPFQILFGPNLSACVSKSNRRVFYLADIICPLRNCMCSYLLKTQ